MKRQSMQYLDQMNSKKSKTFHTQSMSILDIPEILDHICRYMDIGSIIKLESISKKCLSFVRSNPFDYIVIVPQMFTSKQHLFQAISGRSFTQVDLYRHVVPIFWMPELSKIPKLNLSRTTLGREIITLLKGKYENIILDGEVLNYVAMVTNNNLYSFPFGAYLNDEEYEMEIINKSLLNAVDREGNNILLRLIANYDEKDLLKKVRFLVESGINVSHQNNMGRTVIHYATLKDNLELLKYFVDKCGVDIHHVDIRKQNALYFSFGNSNNCIMKYLIERKVNIDQLDDEEMTPLMCVIEESSTSLELNILEKVKTLVLYGATVNLIQTDGLSAALLAIKYSAFRILDYLVKNGASIETTNSLFIELAIESDIPMIMIDYLLFKGHTVNCICSYNMTPLMMAVNKKDLQLIKFLFERGAQISYMGGELMTKALGKFFDEEIYNFLLSKNPPLDTGRSVSPLSFALKYQRSSVIDRIFDRMITDDLISFRSQRNNTYLHLIIMNCMCHHERILNKLLEVIDVNILNQQGRNALFECVSNYDVNPQRDLVIKLLDMGSVIDIYDGFETTLSLSFTKIFDKKITNRLIAHTDLNRIFSSKSNYFVKAICGGQLNSVIKQIASKMNPEIIKSYSVDPVLLSLLFDADDSIIEEFMAEHYCRNESFSHAYLTDTLSLNITNIYYHKHSFLTTSNAIFNPYFLRHMETFTHLGLAIYHNKITIINQLLRMNIFDLNQDLGDDTYLKIALRRNADIELLDLLIDHGADPNLMTNGTTPLSYIIRAIGHNLTYHDKGIVALLKKKADPNIIIKNDPLIIYCIKKDLNPKCVIHLINFGARYDQIINFNGIDCNILKLCMHMNMSWNTFNHVEYVYYLLPLFYGRIRILFTNDEINTYMSFLETHLSNTLYKRTFDALIRALCYE